MKDKVIRGISKDKFIRFFAVNSKTTVQTAVNIHNMSITNSVIFGRLANAAIMMAADLKGESAQLSLQIQSDGIINNVLAVASPDGNLKGYMANPQQEFPINKGTHTFDVRNAIGNGNIKVIKKTSEKTPYIGIVELLYGTISQDIAHYFVQSEQIPTAISLGVLMNPDGSIQQSGGFLIQLLPDTPLDYIEKIENAIKKLPNFTDLMDMNYSIEKIMQEILLKNFDVKITKTSPIYYHCGCSKRKFLDGIKLLGKNELQDAVKKSETITAECSFCNKVYLFTPNELNKIIKDI